jgi:glucose-6-phosphate isomerase
MLKELKGTGLPLYINESSNVLALSAPMVYDGYGTKNAGQMKGLLADETNLDDADIVYDVYRGMRYPDDKAMMDSRGVKYDMTILMDGLLNGECKKTSGHYHNYNPEHTFTYPEVYEVVKGTVLYVLQRADNFDGAPEDLKICDIILAVVKEGQTIIIPPNYGHCAYNIGSGPGIFGAFAYVPCTVSYDPVKYYHGMGYYIKKEGEKTKVVPNLCYNNLPAPKFAVVKENPELGIKFGFPVYNSFKQNPDAFDFLGNADKYTDEIMSMLDMKNTLEDVLK